jgi:hypothetical protein
MDKNSLLDIFSKARQRAARRDQLISCQMAVITTLENEGVDVAESKRLLAVLADAREKDLVEMDWALDELDKTQSRVFH